MIARLGRRLQATLFIESPPAAPLTPARIGAFVLAAALGITAIILRLGFGTSLHSLWAEDGTILLSSAVRDGIGAIGSLYSGNLIIVPRLVGELAAVLPVSWAPAVFALAGNAIVVGCAFIVWKASAAHIRDPFLRGGLASLMVVLPVAGLESVDDTAYVPFYLLFATFWLLLWRPRSTLGAAAVGAFALLTALSTPLGAILIPVALLRVIAARDRRDLMITLPLIGGALAQFAIYELNRSAAPAAGWSWQALEALLQRVVAAGALGQRIAGGMWEVGGWAFLAVVAAAVVALVTLALRRQSRRGRDLVIVAVGLAVVTFLTSAYTRDVGAAMAWPSGTYNGNDSRYAILPVLLLVSALLVQLDIAPRQELRGVWTGAGAAALGLLAIGVVTSFWVGNSGVRGTPRWSTAVDAAKGACAQSAGATASLPTSPPGWTVSLPCSSLISNPAPRR